jgi:Icc-related predicted phosphoesterase
MTETIFAAVGDVHGHMHQMVRVVEAAAQAAGVTPAFVLQVGDFEPHRDAADLATMAAPARFRELGDFADFATGKAQFPWPIWFIGGNHEPYGFLDRVPAGTEVAANCVWMGRAQRHIIGPLSVAGLSGVEVEGAINTPRPPIEVIEKTRKKAYIHFTEDEIAALLSDEPVDVLLVHDWPRGAYTGDAGRRRADDAKRVGNPWARLLVDTLRPKLVLGGHLHWRHRSVIGTSRFAGLANVAAGLPSVALFRHTAAGIEEIEIPVAAQRR